MQRKWTYSLIAGSITLIIVMFVGWLVFLNQEQKVFENQNTPGYTNGPDSSNGSSLFGGSFSNEEDTDTTVVPEPVPVLRQLYNLPIAGYVKQRSNTVRFVDRSTGHVFEIDLNTNDTTRLDQTTIPRVVRAVFVDNGKSVIRQYVQDNILVSVYDALGATTSIELPSHITQLASNQSGSQVAALQRTNTGSVLMTGSPENVRENVLLESHIGGWQMQQVGNTLSLTQNASYAMPGTSYLINTQTKDRVLALQQLPALTTNLAHNEDVILYSTVAANENPLLFVKNLVTRTTTSLNLAGLAEKCVWHPNNTNLYCALPKTFADVQYPDAWYQGVTHFEDSLWNIDTATGLVTAVIDPTQSNGVQLDIIDLTTNTTGDEIFFVNKTDQTLWSVQLPKTRDENTN